jgi:hypothetical protein
LRGIKVGRRHVGRKIGRPIGTGRSIRAISRWRAASSI